MSSTPFSRVCMDRGYLTWKYRQIISISKILRTQSKTLLLWCTRNQRNNSPETANIEKRLDRSRYRQKTQGRRFSNYSVAHATPNKLLWNHQNCVAKAKFCAQDDSVRLRKISVHLQWWAPRRKVGGIENRKRTVRAPSINQTTRGHWTNSATQVADDDDILTDYEEGQTDSTAEDGRPRQQSVWWQIRRWLNSTTEDVKECQNSVWGRRRTWTNSATGYTRPWPSSFWVIWESWTYTARLLVPGQLDMPARGR